MLRVGADVHCVWIQMWAHIGGGPSGGEPAAAENEVRTQEFWAFGGCSPSGLLGTLPLRGQVTSSRVFLAVVCCTGSSPFQVPAVFRRVNVGTSITHLFSLPASVICHMYVSFGIEAQRP